MSKEEQLLEMIDEMFSNYMDGGFDFNSDMTFTEVFKQIFSDAVKATIDILEQSSEGEVP
jgi:hypothetical protein